LPSTNGSQGGGIDFLQFGQGCRSERGAVDVGDDAGQVADAALGVEHAGLF